MKRFAPLIPLFLAVLPVEPALSQCKLYDSRKTLPPSEIHTEVQSARTFKPRIGVYALLTTAKVSTEAQKTLIEINREHREKGLFLVELFTWDRVDELLEEYPTIRDQEYRTLSGEAVHQVQEGLGEINTRLSSIEVTLVSAGADGNDALHTEIDEARSLIQKGEFQTGRFLLLRLRTNKWDQMGDRHRFRVLSNIAVACLHEQDFSRAAQLFLEAATFQPDDAQAGENQALAYHISLPTHQAFEEIGKLRETFPNSVPIMARWVMTAPSAWTLEEIEAHLPATQRGAPEVMTALAARALAECRFGVCEQLASRSIEQRPKSSLPRLLKARSFVLRILPLLSALAAAARAEQLRKAHQLFTEGFDAASGEHDITLQAECLVERSHIHLLLKESSEADDDVQRAFMLSPTDQVVRRALADVKLRHGQINEGITELRGALASRYRPDIALGLAEALRQRGSAADISEATELLQRVLEWPEPFAVGGREYIASILLLLLLREQKWSDAEKVCESLATHGVSSALVLAYRARIKHLQGSTADATQLADSALAALSNQAPLEEVRWVAELLSELGRHSDAFPLWQRIAPRNALTEDTKQLLNCARRLERDDVIMDLCAALRKSGMVDRELLLHEVQIREEYDVEGAIAALNEYLQQSPEDKIVRLRLSIIGTNRNRPGVVDARPSSMPSVHEVDVRTGRIAVHVMKLGGYPDEALAYAYELLRLHFNQADAHLALMFNLHPVEPGPSIPTFEEVTVGSAVSYIEDGETQVEWAIVEDSVNPDASRSEYSPEHPLARALLGKKVGDRLVLATGSVSERAATIQSILSKYVFRYQDSLRNWQIRFPDTPAIESVKVIRKSKDGKDEVDLSAVLASVEQLSASTERLKSSTDLTPFRSTWWASRGERAPLKQRCT